MEFEVVSQKLIEALQQVLIKDKYLLEHDINEPAVSHRLAVYLESQFDGLDVDCEYNGNVDADRNRKYIILLKERADQLGLLKKKDRENDQDLVYLCVYPDIIVHKRGRSGQENNLLIIEVKKSSNPDDGEWDAEKISKFTSNEDENNFNYQYGAFIRFAVGEQPNFTIHWYTRGQRFQ